MPLKKCSEDKQSGWKWGDEGKCYTGPESKKKAIRQGVAIEGPEKFSQKVKAGDVKFTEKDYELVDDALTQAGLGLGDRKVNHIYCFNNIHYNICNSYN